MEHLLTDSTQTGSTTDQAVEAAGSVTSNNSGKTDAQKTDEFSINDQNTNCRKFPETEIPEGFQSATITYGEKEISAAQMKNNADTVLVWLENTADSADKGMYLLDRERGEAVPFICIAGKEDSFVVLTDVPEAEEKKADCPKGDIVCRDLHFSYDNDREILSGVNMTFKRGAFTAIVGESGCGKSTISAILTGRNKGYGGSVSVGETELPEIREADLMENITYISHQSYLFKGTVRDNLLMGKPDASDSELWEVLERVNLADFVRNEKGLDTGLSEKASNLSGGQCQRLALARALLHDSPIYIFDEATSNIDVESENDIMNEIQNLAESKTVILISHRLVNVVKADAIYVMVNGKIAESGKHRELLENKADYEKLWEAQQRLENYGKDGAVQ